MTIYNFVKSIAGCECIVFTIFNCNNDELMKISTEDGEKYNLTVDEILDSNISDYEIREIDIWKNPIKKCTKIEFTIDYDQEDE